LQPPADLNTLQNASVESTGRADARNMRLVGCSDLQGRSAFQPTIIVEQNDRWIACAGVTAA
jgi:hypothetical protein